MQLVHNVNNKQIYFKNNFNFTEEIIYALFIFTTYEICMYVTVHVMIIVIMIYQFYNCYLYSKVTK